MVFVLSDTLIQVVLKPGAATLPWNEHTQQRQDVHDFEDWFLSNASQTIAEDITRDLTTPLFRVNIYHIGDDVYLAMSINHAVYDGISIPLLISEVVTIYLKAPLPQDPVPLSNLLDDIYRSTESTAEAFWKDHFNEVDLEKIRPSRLSRPAHASHIQRTLDISYSDLLRQSSTQGVTFQALCSAAYGVVTRDIFQPGADYSLFGVSSTLLVKC